MFSIIIQHCFFFKQSNVIFLLKFQLSLSTWSIQNNQLRVWFRIKERKSINWSWFPLIIRTHWPKRVRNWEQSSDSAQLVILWSTAVNRVFKYGGGRLALSQEVHPGVLHLLYRKHHLPRPTVCLPYGCLNMPWAYIIPFMWPYGKFFEKYTYTRQQVGVDSHSCGHISKNKLTYKTRRENQVFVFRCRLNRLLLEDWLIKHFRRGRMWGMLHEHWWHVSMCVWACRGRGGW